MCTHYYAVFYLFLTQLKIDSPIADCTVETISTFCNGLIEVCNDFNYRREVDRFVGDHPELSHELPRRDVWLNSNTDVNSGFPSKVVFNAILEAVGCELACDGVTAELCD